MKLILSLMIGLLASFIQSLGLTIQRKSHLQNELLPSNRRKPDYARPIWLFGFTIYLSFNIIGSIFQISTLPLIILGPLGAISLLWNAILAKILLSHRFSTHLILGTILIGLGALLIGLFGLIPDQSEHHNLNQLIFFYSRTPFLIFILILSFIIFILCSLAHLYESHLNGSIDSISLATISPIPSNPSINNHHQPNQDKLQSPKSSTFQSFHNRLENHSSSHYYTNYRSSSTSSPSSPQILSIPFNQQNSIAPIDSHTLLNPNQILSPPSPSHRKKSDSTHHHHHSPHSTQLKYKSSAQSFSHELLAQKKLDRLTFIIGVIYGSSSGTLSGICLLFAKTGVELLIRTISGTENEFFKIQTWLILLVLLITALLQLWYLNKALRLVNPTLICPLAFCFYNLSSIMSSLIYYDQVKLLSNFQIIAISTGTVILLLGVWIVSNAPNHEDSKNMVTEMKLNHDDVEELIVCEDEVTPLLPSSSSNEDWNEMERDEEYQITLLEDPLAPDEWSDQQHQSNDSNRFGKAPISRIGHRNRTRRSLQLDWKSPTTTKSHPFDHLIRQFVVDGEVTPIRGFSFGLGAASPGFEIRPKRKNKWLSQSSSQNTNRSLSYHHDPAGRHEQQTPQREEIDEEER